MNLYFLVEGKRTERKIYPSWLSTLVPQLKRVDRFDAIDEASYYIFSGEGYPSLLRQHLPNAIRDVIAVGRYDALVVCLDADEASVNHRRSEVFDVIAQTKMALGGIEIHVIVQNRCIETWCLGNRRVVSRNPQGERLASYTSFYDVTANDPEGMGVHPDFVLHSPFHAEYLREVFRERGITYSKSRPGHVCDGAFVDQLIARVRDQPQHLGSFQDFLSLCARIRSAVDAPHTTGN